MAGFQRQSPKGLTYPLFPDAPGADLTALVSTLDRYINEQWAQDAATTSRLTYGYKGGVRKNGGAWGRTADGVVVLADNTVNYVERDSTGFVSVNTVGFTGANTPMAKVTTSAGSIKAVEDWRPW